MTLLKIIVATKPKSEKKTKTAKLVLSRITEPPFSNKYSLYKKTILFVIAYFEENVQ